MNDEADSLSARFDQDWEQAVRHFGVVSGYRTFRCDLAHPDTGELTAPHEGAPDVYEEWKKTRTAWERRDLFSRCFLATAGLDQFYVWAVANVFVDNGRSEQALNMLQGSDPPEPGSDFYALHCGAFAQAMLALNHPKEALEWAQSAATANPDDPTLRVLLADTLELSGQHEPAYRIYTELLATAAPSQPDGPDHVADMFKRVFARDTGAVSSPFFALNVGSQMEDPVQADEFWRLAEAEFHHSPQFRLHHAYDLVRKGRVQEAVAKLGVLVDEMPWLREAHVNLLQLLNHLDPDGVKLSPELRQQVEQRIRDNGWTAEGMQSMAIRPA